MENETREFIDNLNVDLTQCPGEGEKFIALAEALVAHPEYGRYILVYVQDLVEYLNWPRHSEYDFGVFPGTDKSALYMATYLAAYSGKFTLNGAIIWDMKEQLKSWKQMEKSSGHQRFFPPDFGYSSWSCGWCGASFVGDRPEDVPDSRDIKCEKDIHRNKPTVVDMKGYNHEDWN